ncbi:MAG: hypothetical protein VX777_02025 [Chlamydiota bacterium]|nr:hypothetical protein [Chlamydiota bacterium]
MSDFKVVGDVSSIKLSSGWRDSEKFISKGRTVGEKGTLITASYKGNQYRLIAKKERHFAAVERIGRGFLGVVAVVCTLGLAVLIKSVRKLFVQDKVVKKFAVLSKSSISETSKTDKSLNDSSVSEKELQSGVNISEETVAKLQDCITKIIHNKSLEGVCYYQSQYNHRVFSLDTAPELIFKMKAIQNWSVESPDDSMRARYEALIKAQTICKTYALGLLVVPNAKLFSVDVAGKKYEIIVEKKLDINPSESAQEQYYLDYASSLNETIRQLAVFICKTGCSNVDWRNNPVLNDAPDQFGCRKIGLIDIEEIEWAEAGLFGCGYRGRGLVGCVTEDQGRIVESVAKQHGVSTYYFPSAYTQRKQEIEESKKLQEYYEKHNITTGFELLEVDIDSLPLELEETGDVRLHTGVEGGEFKFENKTVSMRDVAKDLVREINSLILLSNPSDSLKGKRNILVDTNALTLQQYDRLGVPSGELQVKKEQETKRWLTRILNALVENGYIFKFERVFDLGYDIQA